MFEREGDGVLAETDEDDTTSSAFADSGLENAAGNFLLREANPVENRALPIKRCSSDILEKKGFGGPRNR
jgi:hypothetical protein